MKFFESLNCSLCMSSFVPIANQPQSPRHLNCGKPICHECFEAEKRLKKYERKHQCDDKDCFSNPNFAYSLIDVLSSNSLVHVPIRGGYLLAENFGLPECPVCHEDFTIDGEKQPYFLSCLHDLCKECFEKCRKPNEDEKTYEMRYSVTCPKCNATTLNSSSHGHEPFILKPFNASPKPGTRPVKLSGSMTMIDCDNCKDGDYDMYMLHCLKCRKKVCDDCASRMPQYPSRVPCSTCNLVDANNGNCSNKQLISFLKELPEMVDQLEKMKNSRFRFCDACKALDSIERMFHCSVCKEKVCGACAFEKHQTATGHLTAKLLEDEAMQLSDAIKQISINEIEAYQDLFPILHQRLEDNIQVFLKKLTTKAEILKKKSTFESLQKGYTSCRRLKSDFESTAEEYLPNLRKCNTRLEDLIKDLENDID